MFAIRETDMRAIMDLNARFHVTAVLEEEQLLVGSTLGGSLEDLCVVSEWRDYLPLGRIGTMREATRTESIDSQRDHRLQAKFAIVVHRLKQTIPELHHANWSASIGSIDNSEPSPTRKLSYRMQKTPLT